MPSLYASNALLFHNDFASSAYAPMATINCLLTLIIGKGFKIYLIYF